MSNLTICQECNQNPATYGDGLTWSRCGACQLKHVRGSEPTDQAPVAEAQEGFEHKIVEGLVSIVIPVHLVNYSLFHYTGNCIGSVREHTPEGEYELVVVDNGSPLKPPSPKSYYAHKVIQNEENFGYTKAINQGIRMSCGEYIVLLSNDVQVFDGWLEDMKNEILEGNDLVMAHPMYSLTEPFARAVEAAEVRFGTRKLDPLERDFSCVMFKRTLIDEIGLFDEQFFNYCSDVDFIKRMDMAGRTYKMLNHVATSHLSDATGYSLPETPEVMNQDKEKYAKKWENKTAVSPEKPVNNSANRESRLVRTPETGDSIFFVSDNGGSPGTRKYHHIANPQVLEALGYKFGDEVTTSMKELSSYATYGEEITMKNVEKYA